MYNVEADDLQSIESNASFLVDEHEPKIHSRVDKLFDNEAKALPFAKIFIRRFYN